MRRVLALAACALFVAGCRPQTPQAAGVRASELAIRTLMAAWESADTALILELFSPDATYDDFASQVTAEGPVEIVGYVTAVHAWGDDVYKSIGRVHASETGAVAEWVFSAVQNRPMGDQIPIVTGLEVVLNGVTIIEMRNGLIVRAADYFDTAPMVLQLGGRIELPGGRFIDEGDVGN